MADPSARRRLSLIKAVRTGFRPLYNAANPPKQAMLLEWYLRGLVPSQDLPAVAAAPIWGWQSDWSNLMSAVERLEDRRGETPSRRDSVPSEASSAPVEAELTQLPASSARLRPLLALAPYVARYRGRAVLAFISLTIAAITTLLVPIAVRRMIDFGFTPEGIAMINSYFSVMIAVVAVLAEE